jgi:hypothetical protein
MVKKRRIGRLALAACCCLFLALGACVLPEEPARDKTPFLQERRTLPPKRLARRRLLRRRRRQRVFLAAALILAGLTALAFLASGGRGAAPQAAEEAAAQPAAESGPVRIIPAAPALSQRDKLRKIETSSDYPADLVALARRNAETIDFVYDYPEKKDKAATIDLTQEAASGAVPLLLQWDERWGYGSYGGAFIAESACGPTCLSMAALYLLKDASLTPPALCRFSEENGYRVPDSGTSWTLMSEGGAKLGLSARELPLSEDAMKRALDGGAVIAAVVGPGDFTQDGHFLVLTGYDETGFHLNDPNSRVRSAKTWPFAVLSPQLRNLWALSKA